MRAAAAVLAPSEPEFVLFSQMRVPILVKRARKSIKPITVGIVTTSAPKRIPAANDTQSDRLGIDAVFPRVDDGRFPAKSTVGEVLPLGAIVWREGHDALGVQAHVRRPGGKSERIRMWEGEQPDTFHGLLTTSAEGMWTFRIEAFSDPYLTWTNAITKKMSAGQGVAELGNDLEIGALLMDRAAAEAEARGMSPLVFHSAANQLRGGGTAAQRTQTALSVEVTDALWHWPLRDVVTRSSSHRVWVDRAEARFSSWYEFFPRSTGGWDDNGTPVHGTFATSKTYVDHAADMGFDVVYLPPIHPIGTINRKGRNNTLTPEDGDVGSPWAIGSAAGGHDATHPDLGTLDDFRDLVAYARSKGVEVALDLALQCAPDHPWAAAHPEWFTVLPDGTIAYAENPPKKYQDIYPLHFDADPEGLYAEVHRVVKHWIDAGVTIFRVDNPHTKPANFWRWLIAEIKREHPGVLFLSEAFTRPARMFGLARRGFSQSYTYFTWKTSATDLREFAEQLVNHADEARPNLFTNTPDILHASLQYGGPAMFSIRATLAATLSPSWGVYSGFEIFEHLAVKEGSEEYLDSEKYELRPRDFARAAEEGNSLVPYLRQLNEIRRTHPALQQFRTLRFHHVEGGNLVAYSKLDSLTGDTVLVVVTLDSHSPQEGTLHIDMGCVGHPAGAQLHVRDELTGAEFHWGEANYVRLDPAVNVAHIVHVPAGPSPLRNRVLQRDISAD